MTAAPGRNIDPAPEAWQEEARGPDGAALVVDVAGFEGPLDLLLQLARSQKVDLARISVLALAQQYLRFVAEARRLSLELAADYLVMAAWLAYLKSRLLLPEPPAGEGESGEELAAALQLRLKRLDAMREAAQRLMGRHQLGREVFARGAPEPLSIARRTRYTASLFDLLTAYAAQRQRRAPQAVRIAPRAVWSLQDARALLTRLVGVHRDWAALDRLLVEAIADPRAHATALASSFAASLELIREGRLEARQAEAFAPLYLKARAAPAAGTRPA